MKGKTRALVLLMLGDFYIFPTNYENERRNNYKNKMNTWIIETNIKKTLHTNARTHRHTHKHTHTHKPGILEAGEGAELLVWEPELSETELLPTNSEEQWKFSQSLLLSTASSYSTITQTIECF